MFCLRALMLLSVFFCSLSLIAAADELSSCAKCSGKGYSRCARCSGSGVVKDLIVDCSTCKGTKMAECSRCDEAGLMRCSRACKKSDILLDKDGGTAGKKDANKEEKSEKDGGKTEKKEANKDGKSAEGKSSDTARYLYIVTNPAHKKWRDKAYNQGKLAAGEEPPTTIPCPVCSGVGREKCKYCKGTRSLTCKACNGKGSAKSEGECTECKGKKNVFCPDCAVIEGSAAEATGLALDGLKKGGIIDESEYWVLVRMATARSKGKKDLATGLSEQEALLSAERGWATLDTAARASALESLLKAHAAGAIDLGCYLYKQQVSGLTEAQVDSLEGKEAESNPVLREYITLKQNFRSGMITHEEYQKGRDRLALR